MESIKVYKDRAIESLSGNWAKGTIATLVFVLVFYVPAFVVDIAGSSEANVGNLWYLILLPLTWGFTVFFLDIARDEATSYGQLFDGFKEYGRIFTTTFLVGLYTVLWTLLLIVPGVIKQYSYMMTPYILKDNPEMKNNEAIEKSMKMMDGHKMDLFMLDLSLIGWAILSILTLGIGFLFLYPYQLTAHAHFYEDLKKEQEGYDVAMAE